MRKSVAWLLRFKQYLLCRIGKVPDSILKLGPLTVEEIERAADELVKITQRDASTNNQSISGRYAKLSLVIYKDIVGVGGRLNNSSLTEESKHPAIPPYNHHVTKLIVRYYHMNQGHAGTSQTLTAIRQRYWIIKGTKYGEERYQ